MNAKCPKCGSVKIDWIKANTFTGICENCHYQGMMKSSPMVKRF